jgi:hypothetical protein
VLLIVRSVRRSLTPTRPDARFGRFGVVERTPAAIIDQAPQRCERCGSRAGSILAMEIVEASDSREHKWLEWLGLEEPPPEADSWVPVARDFQIDDVNARSSSEAARLVGQLSRAGIQARQRSYELDAAVETAESLTLFAGGASVSSGSFTHVAVGVHNRDRARATEIVRQFEHDSELELRKLDAELTHEALEAGPSPEV